VAADDGEEVVEVMGQPPRQPPDALHLLRLPELLLQLPPLGDVSNDHRQKRSAPGLPPGQGGWSFRGSDAGNAATGKPCAKSVPPSSPFRRRP
jgi:hypothetical protein